MEDAAGMTIRQVDTVAFNSTPGDRGRVVQAVPSTPRSSNMMLQVQRVDGTRVEAKSGDLTIVDRSCLRPGMVVVSASDPGSQLGVVMAAATALDLVRLVEDGGQEAVARGVPATELRRVTGLCLGDYVVSAGGRWLGRVVETYVDVDVLFDDGGRCRVTEADRKLRTVETGYLNGYANTPFYQGRRVVGRRSPVFKTSRWLNGSYWKPSYVEGTVAMVKMTGVLVCWLASPDTTGVSAPPAYQQNLDDLIFFSAANIIGTWSVGDRCFFRRNPDDHESSSRGPPTRKGRQMRRRRRRSNRTRQMRFEFERPMSVADTHTTVDVLWQDGTRQRRMPSVALLPFVAKNEHDFFPGQHVRRAADDDGPQEGVVRSLDCVEQTVRVSWLNNSSDETLSAYHLRRILDHDVFYGNVVVRLDGDAAGDLSWVGRIVHLCDDGQVQVKWGDGNTTEVLPREIVVVKEQPLVEIFRQMGDWWVYDDGSDAAQDETTNEADTVWTWTQQNTAPSGSDSGSDTDDGPAATRIIARVIQPVIRLGSRVIEEGKRFRVSGWTTTAGLAGSENIEPVSSGVDKAAEADATTAGRIEAFRFLQFDVVQSPPDHHYLDTSGQGTSGGRKWTKRVQREWKILENDLPDTIYVRAFEDRMGLLRAVMVGVSGTPYQDGLFFDLQLSSPYPAEPPLVNYRSFGLRVNPNLYESGTVCLSLLNTFGGKDTELWSPESSTVLQVLVSIQGLVLTAQPYYNESGYASQVGTPVGRRNELPYSENTYLLSLQTMLHLLRRPPAGFEDFVEDHFRRRGQCVLRACEAYREGCCLVGTLDEEGNATEASTTRPCSTTGFRLALANVVPRLKVAFADIGAQGCEEI